ncbi:hypothetical protein DKX38_022980 [Salix brachista]|uniref:CRAL-TRIO domain-containing protein n=1 Tax=Salix brachista TaxID=2182728 RepID=A0A5N5K0W5_9ROSI|nr:hypothetical protein DKX38_022980 [Salix brachista]
MSHDIPNFSRSGFLDSIDNDLGISCLKSRYLKWRREFVPHGSISLLETPNEVAQNKMFLQGSDKKGRPITVILGARHFQSKGGCHQDKRKLLSLETLEGWGYVNRDIHGYLGGLSILQEYYPERLTKIVFVDNSKLKSTLLEEIDQSQIPDIYGGDLPLIPNHESK